MIGHLEKCHALATLHDGPDAFIIPNPWDAGSARLLQGLGFKALATTSSGFAFTHGRLDGATTLEQKLLHCESLAGETTIPVSADFEDGYSDSLSGVRENVERLIATGVAGCSIEDFSRERQVPFEQSQAVERLAMAKEAFEATGADVLYAPCVRSLEDLRTITAELDKPFNVLVPFLPGAQVADLAEHGARRISLGGALTWISLKPILDASAEMLEQGTFSFLSSARVGSEVQKHLARE